MDQFKAIESIRMSVKHAKSKKEMGKKIDQLEEYTSLCASNRGACTPKNVRLDIQKREYVFYTLYISDTIASQRFAIIENLD